MTWFRVDDKLADHPKLEGLEGAELAIVLGVWVLAGSDCARRESDGHITLSRLRGLFRGPSPALRRAVETLLARGLWETTPDGFLFHDWAIYNPTHEKLEAQRDADAARQGRARDKRRTAAGHRPLSAPSHAVTPDATTAVSHEAVTSAPDPDPDPRSLSRTGARELGTGSDDGRPGTSASTIDVSDAGHGQEKPEANSRARDSQTGRSPTVADTVPQPIASVHPAVSQHEIVRRWGADYVAFAREAPRLWQRMSRCSSLTTLIDVVEAFEALRIGMPALKPARLLAELGPIEAAVFSDAKIGPVNEKTVLDKVRTFCARPGHATGHRGGRPVNGRSDPDAMPPPRPRIGIPDAVIPPKRATS